MKMKFQVAVVHKPLLSVRRVIENGNVVNFGPKPEDNYILNRVTGDRLKLRLNKSGSFMMDVSVLGAGKEEITIDSGAEESVCPLRWNQHFGLKESPKTLRFRGADGKTIKHHGYREVYVESPF